MSDDDAVAEWIERATEDLQVARLVLAQGYVRAAAYHAQQAAEKALKAALAQAGLRPPKTHDLLSLLTSLPATSRPVIDPILTRQITDWAVSGRYPTGDDPLPSEAEVVAALNVVEQLLGGQA